MNELGRRLWADPAGRAGTVILLLLILAVIALPPMLPDHRVQPDIVRGAQPPSAHHLLGTDNLNRDVFARVVRGGQISLLVAAGAVLMSVTLGTLVGLVAGYAGGWVDGVLMRLVDATLAVPRLFLLLLLVAALEHIPLGILILSIGATGWLGTSRLVRAEVLRLKALDFTRGAVALGARPSRVIFTHLLPNVTGPLAVATTLAVGDVILLEAGLSFLGLGVQPPTPSWGGMILDAKPYIVSAPWSSLAPGAAIVLTVLAVNLVGDALSHAQAEGG
ncbi:MAG: ABC transporter permease [Gemmatimonadales bacterium]